MPQTTPERAARWESDMNAMAFLKSAGFELHRDWVWRHPERKTPTEQELDAAIYLIEEWDFGGIEIT